MADIKNIITLGIGASPGNISFFLLLGLDTAPSPRYLDLNVYAQPSSTASLIAQLSPIESLTAQPSPTEGLKIV